MIRILVVDDEEPFRRLLKKELGRKGFEVQSAADGREGLALLRKDSFDVVLLDIMMPGIDGISVMKELARDAESPAVIVLTGKATVETAVEAMKHGAFDYLTKPYKLDELVVIVNRGAEFSRLRVKNRLLQQELVRKETPFPVVFRSRRMEEVFALIRKIAPTDSTIFIRGESGTGKELIANTIWHHSRRSGLPLVALNCATLSENLIESELFGHEKGAFTSAYQTKHGLVEVADKGTLFLDEIGEMPLGLQAKLLRFLDSGEFRRVGGNTALKVDVRVIAATNKDLESRIETGSFREDLYYRLNVINVVLPSLRERPDDIGVLAEHFLKIYSGKLSKEIQGFMPDALDVLLSYSWPGNVRELENVIERAAIICDNRMIGTEDLSVGREKPALIAEQGLSLEDVERDHILRVLRDTEGNQSRASQILEIDRKTLYLKIRRYGLLDYLRKSDR